jgi:isoquinoline 1-oxidoreductase alpha subunit
MRRFVLRVNGRDHEVDVDPDTPLLWVLRDSMGLSGTKYGCGEGLCGICTVHLDGIAVRSCQVPVSEIGAAAVTTIEGISEAQSHPVEEAWVEEDVPQCGYCQPGQVMAAVALLNKIPNPTEEEVERALDPVLCRCGTYLRIRKAMKRAAGEVSL